MFRLYQHISSRLSTFMARREKTIFTTGARILAALCIIVAVIIAHRLGSQFF